MPGNAPLALPRYLRALYRELLRLRDRDRLEEFRRDEFRLRPKLRVEAARADDPRDDPRDDDFPAEDPRRAPELDRLVDPELPPFEPEGSPFGRIPEDSLSCLPNCSPRLRRPFFNCGGVRGLSSARSTPFLCSPSVRRCLAIIAPLLVAAFSKHKRQLCAVLIQPPI
jgi:hypothetical protein